MLALTPQLQRSRPPTRFQVYQSKAPVFYGTQSVPSEFRAGSFGQANLSTDACFS